MKRAVSRLLKPMSDIEMLRQLPFLKRHNPNRPRELIRMKSRLLLAVWLVYGSLAAAQDAPNPHVRFFTIPRKPLTSSSIANTVALFRQTPRETTHTVTSKSVWASTR